LWEKELLQFLSDTNEFYINILVTQRDVRLVHVWGKSGRC